MSSYRDVTPAAPCLNCGAHKWCSRSDDAQICMKAPWPEGKEQRDKDGVPFWISFAQPLEERKDQSPQEKPKKEAAPVEQRHRVYAKLLDLIGLSQEHHQHLAARGLTDEQITRAQYRTMPRDRGTVARNLLDVFPEHILAAIPGLYLAEGKHGPFWSIAGAQGIIIPCRDQQGRITALKVRANTAGPNRYTYISSKKYEGASSGRQAHVPLLAPGAAGRPQHNPGTPSTTEDRAAESVPPGSSPAGAPLDQSLGEAGAPTTAPAGNDTRTALAGAKPSNANTKADIARVTGQQIRVTEGELKADLATVLSGTLTLSVPGVDAWSLALPLLTELRPARVLLAFDADWRENPKVLRSLQDAASAFQEHAETLIEVWDEEHKGIDDLLHAGKLPDAKTLLEFQRDQAPLPAIIANNRDLPDVTRDTLRALQLANEPPRLFQRGTDLVRVRAGEGTSGLEVVTPTALRGVAARSASFRKQTETKNGTKEETIFPPVDVVQDILALPDWPFPHLQRVLNSPTFLPDGTLLDAQGYHPGRRVYFAGRTGWDIPRTPTASQVQRAKALLTRELLGDFPFVDPGADVTHTAGAILLPFVREMITGPTPLHLIAATSPGTGKSLMADVLCYPGMGCEAVTITASREGEEWRKTLTAVLQTAPAYILIDNVGGRLDSPDLASATTQPVWSDRLLSTSTVVRIPVLNGWLATANSPTMSDEVVRRTVPIFLDARCDNPWERRPEGGFRHPDLKGWARANRDQLITACLTVIQHWIASGRPPGRATLGSYESWASVVGGILACAGFEGFLTNQAKLYSKAADQMAEWRVFLASWWGRWKGDTIPLRALFGHCYDRDLLLGVINSKTTERGMLTSLALALRKNADRQIGGYRIVVQGKDRKGAPEFSLERVEAQGDLLDEDLPDLAPPTAAELEGLVL